MKPFTRLSDETLNKIGRRYNLFAAIALTVITLTLFASVFASLVFGWKALSSAVLPAQIALLVVWAPNLALIAIRADRDYRAANERLTVYLQADREFFAAHAARMAWVTGEPGQTPPTSAPPTKLN